MATTPPPPPATPGRGDRRLPALLVLDEQLRVLAANLAVEALLGWVPEELVGRPLEDLLASKSASLVSNGALQPLLLSGLTLLSKDGAEIDLVGDTLTASSPATTVLAVCLPADPAATDHVRALLESTPDAMVGVDERGVIEIVNAAAERMFSWSAAELIGMPVEILVPRESRDTHVLYRDQYARHPSPRPMGIGRMLHGQRKDGSLFPAEVSLIAVRKSDGQLLSLAAVRDIGRRIEEETARERTALAAQRSTSIHLESLGQLAGGIAHDFNNLIGIILSYTTLLERSTESASNVDDLGEIRAAAERAAGLTRQLLTFARRDVVQRAPLDLVQVLQRVMRMLGRTLGGGIEVRLDLPLEPVIVVADPHHVEQIAINIAVNARDAMAATGGTLLVSVVRRSTPLASDSRGDSPGHAVIRFTDHGPGMSPETIALAFEPFFTTKPRGEGSGLGLATVYGIVAQNNGEVSITSQLGQGTTVDILLPTTVERVPRLDEPQVRSLRGHERVLLVQEESSLRSVSERVLRAQGYAVRAGVDGVEALRMLTADPRAFDIVVTDLAMPNMRGDELARRVRTLYPDIPFIFVTGSDSAGGSELPSDSRILNQPVDVDTLLRAMRELLDDSPGSAQADRPVEG